MIKHMLTLIWNKRKKNTLLFVEIFFCFLIVFAISTFAIGNFRNYLSPYGYEVDDLWHVNVRRSLEAIDSSAMIDTRTRVKNELEAIDGIEEVAFGGMSIPFSGSMWSYGTDAMGFDVWTTGIQADADYNEVFDFNMVEGRWFEPSDTLGKYRPAIVNQKLIDEYFQDRSLLDSVFEVNGEWRIVGVIDHFRYRDGFEEEQPVTIFYPEETTTDMSELYIRVSEGSGAEVEEELIGSISQLLKTEDVVVNDLNENRIRRSLETWVLLVVFLTIGGFLIFNIALGLFGVLFYSISKRRPEIGVRRAMGATGGEISRQITFEVYLVAVLAMLVAGAFAIQVPLLGLAEEMVRPVDAYWALFAAFGLISVVVLACAYGPARSAASLHPAEVLHEN
ncbi:MAG: ABC transporter permease [Bacteroidota bacterium]